MKVLRKRTNLKIAILYPASVPWMARCLDGIREHAREQGDWHLFITPPTLHGVGESAMTLRELQGWKGDGIIIASNEVKELTRARRMKIPVLNLAGGLKRAHGIPRVMVDHHKAGRLAAEHLIERGLTSLAIFGWTDLHYAEQRKLGFLERAAESSLDCQVMLQKSGEEHQLTWDRRIADPAKWLRSLPKPSGVFAVHDHRAQIIMEACQEAGLRIPDDVAVIGMDNDETICQHSVPTLTSVSRNSKQIGRVAARILEAMILGREETAGDHLVPPRGVFARQSTDRFYIADPVAAAAVTFMRENLDKSINIANIADHVGVSKRTLEYHFLNALNDSPRNYFSRLRVNQVERLMRDHPDWSMRAVASASGFQTMPTFYSTFKKLTGTSISQYRKAMHVEGGGAEGD